MQQQQEFRQQISETFEEWWTWRSTKYAEEPGDKLAAATAFHAGALAAVDAIFDRHVAATNAHIDKQNG